MNGLELVQLIVRPCLDHSLFYLYFLLYFHFHCVSQLARVTGQLESSWALAGLVGQPLLGIFLTHHYFENLWRQPFIFLLAVQIPFALWLFAIMAPRPADAADSTDQSSDALPQTDATTAANGDTNGASGHTQSASYSIFTEDVSVAGEIESPYSSSVTMRSALHSRSGSHRHNSDLDAVSASVSMPSSFSLSRAVAEKHLADSSAPFSGGFGGGGAVDPLARASVGGSMLTDSPHSQSRDRPLSVSYPMRMPSYAGGGNSGRGTLPSSSQSAPATVTAYPQYDSNENAAYTTTLPPALASSSTLTPPPISIMGHFHFIFTNRRPLAGVLLGTAIGASTCTVFSSTGLWLKVWVFVDS